MFESKGWLRTVGSAMAAVGGILTLIPEPTCVSIGTVLVKVGIAIGGTGVVRAGAVKFVKYSKGE